MKLSKKIFIPLTILISLNSTVMAEEKSQIQRNSELIEKGKKELSKEDLFKLKKEINQIPKESKSDYVNLPKNKPIKLIKALSDSYDIEKEGFLFNKASKKKTPIKVTFNSTGISNPIIDEKTKEKVYKEIKKTKIRMVLTDDKLEINQEYTLDNKMNVLRLIEENKVNGKTVSTVACNLITDERNNTPEETLPIYNSKPYQLKCNDGTIITSKYDLNFGDKEFEGSLDFFTRIRGNDYLATFKTKLKINSDGEIYNITYYQNDNNSVVVVK